MNKRVKMPIEERAKQFMPFSALRGLELALLKKEKEKMLVKKKILADDKKEELSRRLNEIKIGDMVEIVYYKNGEYFTISGNLQKTDKNKKIIRINEKNVNICDISEIIL